MKAQRPVADGMCRYCQVGLDVTDLAYRDAEGFYRLRDALHGALEFDDALDVFGSPDESHLIVTGRAPMNFGTEEALLQQIAGIVWEHTSRPAIVSLDLTYFVETYRGKYMTEEADWQEWKSQKADEQTA